MNNILAFHKSVQGSNHIEWGRPCEDASGSYANPEKQYYLAAVSDGHGADECYRADKGSKIAVEIAIKDLQELAEKMTRTPEVEARFYQDMLSSPRYQQMTMRHLTDVIHAEWVESVRQDLQDHPPTEAELGFPSGKEKNELHCVRSSGASLRVYSYGSTVDAEMLAFNSSGRWPLRRVLHGWHGRSADSLGQPLRGYSDDFSL